jgi:AmmeMemoRadiSam system protein A
MQEFDQNERKILLEIARNTITYCLENDTTAMPLNLQDFPEHLRAPRACFVSLHENQELRGCIGSLQAHQPLVIDVMHNAYNAAFRDPRFHPVTAAEFHEIKIEISVLSQPEAMHFSSEDELQQQIRPGIDGLILTDNGYRGTFLPVVWEQIPDKHEFLQHLKMKAGLPANCWSNTLKVERYTAELID